MYTLIPVVPCLSALVWRQDELQHINATTSGAERKAALCALLEQEAQLIASIGRHKSHAREEGKERDTKKFLDTVSSICMAIIIIMYIAIHNYSVWYL